MGLFGKQHRWGALIAACCFVCFLSGAARAATVPFTGEKIHYDIRKFGLKVGWAQLVFGGERHLHGRPVYLIVFRAKALNFFDEEKIYVDTQHFRPVLVERNLNLWGKRERIMEHYDQDKGLVRIVKRHGRKTSEQTLHTKGPVENIYGFIYRYRLRGNFVKNDTMNIHLPTQDVKMEVTGTDTIKAGRRKYDAYEIQSNPAQYRLWFSQTPERIPLRIDGAVGVANAAMIMASYHQGRDGVSRASQEALPGAVHDKNRG